MAEILAVFGIDWKLIAIQIFNIVLLGGVLWYFLYTPVLKIIDERQKKIEAGVRDAKKAEKLKESIFAEQQHRISTAETEAAAIVQRAKKTADERAASLMSEARDRAKETKRSAQQRGKELSEEIKREAEADIAKMAVLAAEKVLREHQAP